MAAQDFQGCMHTLPRQPVEGPDQENVEAVLRGSRVKNDVREETLRTAPSTGDARQVILLYNLEVPYLRERQEVGPLVLDGLIRGRYTQRQRRAPLLSHLVPNSI